MCDALDGCLRAEDDDGRAIIRMCYFEGKSDAEAAAALGISERSVRRTRGDFVKRLRQLLRPE